MTEQNEDLEVANPDDFFVKRNEDDELQPVKQKIPGVEQHLRVIPFTLGDVNEYGLDEGGVANLTDSELADIFNKHLADLDEEISEDDVSDNMIGFGKTALLETILRASGYDMQNALHMEQFKQLADMPEGNLEKILAFAENQQN